MPAAFSRTAQTNVLLGKLLHMFQGLSKEQKKQTKDFLTATAVPITTDQAVRECLLLKDTHKINWVGGTFVPPS